jgi:hypothetical protein
VLGNAGKNTEPFGGGTVLTQTRERWVRAQNEAESRRSLYQSLNLNYAVHESLEICLKTSRASGGYEVSPGPKPRVWWEIDSSPVGTARFSHRLSSTYMQPPALLTETRN